MTRFEINLATSADDHQLRALLAATPMEGNISLAFAREPSYFAAAQVDGTTSQIGVVRDRDSGQIVGMGSRSISTKYIQDKPISVGYLGGLRLLPQFRGQAGLLARGYQFLRNLHTDQQAPFYLTTIATDNHAANQLLCSGRAGLPVYHAMGSYHTVAISTTRAFAFKAAAPPSVTIREAGHTDRDAILRFLNEHGRTRQFFPVYMACDLFSPTGILKDLQPEDVLLAFRNGDIVGTLANWDQRRFKQTIIHSYHGWLRPLRPLYNAWAFARRQPTLPAAGAVIDARVAAIPVARNDEPEVFQQLLDATIRRSANEKNSMLLIGLHERDPLLAVAQRYAGRTYATQLFVVYWPEETPDVDRLAERVPYLELGCL